MEEVWGRRGADGRGRMGNMIVDEDGVSKRRLAGGIRHTHTEREGEIMNGLS